MKQIYLRVYCPGLAERCVQSVSVDLRPCNLEARLSHGLSSTNSSFIYRSIYGV